MSRGILLMHPAEHRAQLSRLRASEMISVVLTEFYRQLTKLTKVRLRRSRRGIAIAIPAQSSVSYGSFRACFSDSPSTTLPATGATGLSISSIGQQHLLDSIVPVTT
jgi:hypothetical protein